MTVPVTDFTLCVYEIVGGEGFAIPSVQCHGVHDWLPDAGGYHLHDS